MVEGLVKRCGGVTARDGIDVSVPNGTVLVLLFCFALSWVSS